MSKSLDNACKALQTVAAGLESVEKAEEYAKESATLGVFAVSYPEEGEVDAAQLPETKSIHTIITEIHFKTVALELTLADAIPMIEEFAIAALADPTLGGTCDTIVGPIHYRFGYLNWGGKKESHVGPQFRIKVKIRTP